MKNYLAIFSLIFTLTMPNLVLADALDDFKAVITNKRFLIKYTVQTDSTNDNDKRNTGYFMRSDGNAKILDNDFSKDIANFTFTEGINGEDFFIEIISTQKFGKMNVAVSYYKIGNKLFQISRMIKDGKYKDFAKKIAALYEINDKKIYGNIHIKNIVDVLSNEENYSRAGSGTNDESLNYFDVKSKNDSNALKAMRFYFDGDTIKRIAIAEYSKNLNSDEIKGNRSIIEIEEFNSNPDENYFKLPEKFKKTQSFGSWKYNGTVLNFMKGGLEDE